MKQMIDRARDLFLDNPNQTAEGAALILLEEYKEVADQYGVTPESLYEQSLECANTVIKARKLVADLKAKDKRHIN